LAVMEPTIESRSSRVHPFLSTKASLQRSIASRNLPKLRRSPRIAAQNASKAELRTLAPSTGGNKTAKRSPKFSLRTSRKITLFIAEDRDAKESRKLCTRKRRKAAPGKKSKCWKFGACVLLLCIRNTGGFFRAEVNESEEVRTNLRTLHSPPPSWKLSNWCLWKSNTLHEYNQENCGSSNAVVAAARSS
jgi:hypothetical protein